MAKPAKDLTTGDPLRLLAAFVLPMLIGDIVQQLYSLADSVIVGQFVGKNAFAAIGATMPVLNVMIVVIIGFNVGISIVTARYVGAKDVEKVKNTLVTACMIALALAAVLASVGSACVGPILRLLNTPEDIMEDARSYLFFNFATCIGPIAYNIFSGVLRSAGDSRSPLRALILSSVLNIALDLLFVLAFHWGVAGAALATGISQIVSAVYELSALYRRHRVYWFGRQNLRFHADLLGEILKFGMPMAVSRLFTSLGGMFIQSVINGFGTTVVAGYTAASRLDQLALSGIMSVGSAASTFAGQNTGARRPDRVRAGVRASWVIGLAVCAAFGLMLFFFGGVLVRMFVSAGETGVIEVATGYLRIVSPLYLLGCGMYLYMDVMRGMGEIVLPTAASFAELLGKLLAAWLLSRAFGYRVMWFAWPAGWAVSLALTAAYYYVFLWKKPRYAALGEKRS